MSTETCAVSGIQGTGLMGVPQDSAEVSLDGQETPISADPTKVWKIEYGELNR
jgi:hypothetical protein